MKEKSQSIKSKTQTKKGKRQYASPNATIFSHPTRIQILENLKSGDKTTNDLEGSLGENRINLYHHLNILENENIISSKVENRKKIFQLVNDNKLFDSEIQIVFIDIPDSPIIRKKVENKVSEIINICNNEYLQQEFSKIKDFKGKKIIIEFK